MTYQLPESRYAKTGDIKDANTFTPSDVLDAYAAGLAASKWVPVSERMPEKMVPVLVYNGKQFFIEQWWGKDFTFDYSITHWQPIPPPPESEPT